MCQQFFVHLDGLRERQFYSVVIVILQVLVAIVGLMGNIMSVLVLSLEEMKNCFNSLLIILAMFDTVFIILVTFDYSFARGLEVNELLHISNHKL